MIEVIRQWWIWIVETMRAMIFGAPRDDSNVRWLSETGLRG